MPTQSKNPSHLPSTADSISSADRTSRLSRLGDVLEHLYELLPAQGPINVFIHHNTLHALEHLPFHQAVSLSSRIFGCQVYLPEDRYRQELETGRIRDVDLEAVLRHDLGERADQPVLSSTKRIDLRMAMLRYPVRLAPRAELRWFIAETDSLVRFRPDAPPGLRERFIANAREWANREIFPLLAKPRPSRRERPPSHKDSIDSLVHGLDISRADSWSESTWEAFGLKALWRMVRDGARAAMGHSVPTASIVRHRDLLFELGGEDTDALVHEVLVRFCGAFLDQGLSTCVLPGRDLGFFQAFCALYRDQPAALDLWRSDLAAEIRRLEAKQAEPMDVVLESLDALGIPDSEVEDYLTRTLLALRGWAGMIRQIELRSDRVTFPIAEGSIVEFLAVRLLLDRLAVAYVAKTSFGYSGPLDNLRSELQLKLPKSDATLVNQRAFLAFKLAQVLGWLPSQLKALSHAEWTALFDEIADFSAIQRQRVYHLAYERHYRNQTLDAIGIAARRNASQARSTSPPFQVVCCIDEREESFRRHLEEIAPECETFSIAGFFNVAMYYRGAADAHYVPLCPIVVRPDVWVREDVVTSLAEVERRRAFARRLLAAVTHRLHLGSRTLAGGLLTASLGVLATVPLVTRILFPRLTARVRRACGRYVQPPPATQLQLERSAPMAGEVNGHVGLSLQEMARAGESFLRDMGLTSNFAPVVVILGHGSSSLNNPHNSAYNCGACGGGGGGPNARAIARILNDPRVRFMLAEHGLSIPDETQFVGGLHNTCNDSITYYDLDRLPPASLSAVERARVALDEACNRNAHERCRRFQSAPLDMSLEEAREHVEERSEDLAQTRPECGHATNAVCFVGRRDRVRGLFMDRRTFLVSYDPAQDSSDTQILLRLLQAVFPVCAGINLEYYFSYVDPSGWGCGTKLPHNLTSLLGVMDGAASDLRTGLPWQMVEIHEPVRLLVVVEASPDQLCDIMQRNASIARLCRNEWVQLATLDPHSDSIHLFVDGQFVAYRSESDELPTVRSSADWYRGHRHHLGYALIDSRGNS